MVSVVVIAGALPEPRLVVQQQVDAADPLRRLPQIQVGDQQPGRAAVLGRQILVLVLIGDHAWLSSRSCSGRLVV